MTADLWLPIPPDEIEGLPEGLNPLFWDGGPTGEQEFPGDPADCVFYVVPYMKRQPVKVRPLPRMRNVRVVQTLTAGVDDVTARLADLPPGVQLCNARGVHEASTAELALTLYL
jgi:phosphoglycerate dehydrogenase-like enzyme